MCAMSSAASPALPHQGAQLTVAVDATPLLGRRTGIGRYTEHLVAGLARRPEIALTATAFTGRGRDQLPAALPPGVRSRALGVPAAVLRAAWQRVPFPPVELLAGRTQVFHATNYVLPPLVRAKGVLSIHDLGYLHLPDTVHRDSLAYRTLVPRGLRRAAVVGALTNYTADEISEAYGFPRDRIVVTGVGVDEAWFDPPPLTALQRTSLGLPEQFVLFVGTREPRKGLPTLLAAHAALRRDHPDSPPLVLIGATGWGEQQDLPADVLALDYIDQQLLPSVVAEAAALVMPSIYEGAGIPVLEAMAAHTPVVISDTGPMVEVAGGHASIFGVSDVDALTDRLAAVLAGEHPDLGAAHRHARRWTWGRVVDRCVDAYRLAMQLD